MPFRVLIIGGTGQVVAAVVRALVAEPSCAEVVMVNRKAILLTANHRLRQVILDTGAAQFSAEVTELARSMVARFRVRRRLSISLRGFPTDVSLRKAANEFRCSETAALSVSWVAPIIVAPASSASDWKFG